MRPRPDFGRILDELLEPQPFARASWPGPAPTSTGLPGPQPVFLFGMPFNGFHAETTRSASTSRAPAWTPVYGAGTGAQLRRPRRLTPVQQAALDQLRSLGAALTSDFTDAEIKSAFRALARQYHPDTHPGAPDVERHRLSRAFATACESYRALTTSIH